MLGFDLHFKTHGEDKANIHSLRILSKIVKSL